MPPDSLKAAVAGLHAMLPQAPVHIHIAEQTQEVDDCLAWSGQRPVQWLMEHAPVDPRWCLIHATHMKPEEYASAARSGAVAGICPTTEANLGDGIFDMPLWLQHGGRWGVGSDSHATVNAAEELLMLEYSQRLHLRQRNVLGGGLQPQVATSMTLQAVAGGAQASGRVARVKWPASSWVDRPTSWCWTPSMWRWPACRPTAPMQAMCLPAIARRPLLTSGSMAACA